MKKIVTLFTYFVLLTTISFAQKLEVNYQEIVKVNAEEFKGSVKFSTNGKESTIPTDVYNDMIKNMQEPKDFILTMSFGDSGNGLFKNLTTKDYLKSVKSFDKTYTIKDKLTEYKWQLTRETKKLIGFDVKKATAIVDSTTTVIAWYAPSIAIKDGPGIYNGLPGLILEVEIKNSKNKGIESSTIRATEVKEVPNLKPIEKPKDKNTITNEEYKALSEKAMERLKQMSSEGVSKD